MKIYLDCCDNGNLNTAISSDSSAFDDYTWVPSPTHLQKLQDWKKEKKEGTKWMTEV